MDERIFHLCKQISENLSHDWSVEEMANGFGLSKWHFQKLFKSETGVTPKAFLRDLRFQKAADLLESTFLLIKQIATETGFSDYSHFARDFKKNTG